MRYIGHNCNTQKAVSIFFNSSNLRQVAWNLLLQRAFLISTAKNIRIKEMFFSVSTTTEQKRTFAFKTTTFFSFFLYKWSFRVHNLNF